MAINTPPLAEKVEDLNDVQRKLVRDSIGIIDNPIYPDRTYIEYIASAGGNVLPIITDGSSTYTITKGNGDQPTSYTDTGGSKTLNYDTAGRYIITIEGNFNGLSFNGQTQTVKDKIGSIKAGSNYPSTIPANAFSECNNLEWINIKGISTVGNQAFYECDSLKDVVLHATTLGDECFYNCGVLKTSDLGYTQTLGLKCFSLCDDMEYISCPIVTTVGNECFRFCKMLKEIHFQAENITERCFEQCYSLKDISLNSDSLSGFVSIGDSAFKNCHGLTVFSFQNKTGSTFTIGVESFLGCKNLTTVNLGNVLSIGNSAFSGCINLLSFECVLQNSITLGQSVFIGCTTLNTFRMSVAAYSSHSFGTDAFSGVSLSDLVLPNAGLTTANAIDASAVASGLTKLNGYRLMY